MRVLLVSSEAYPLVKTGGLADVAGALPPALIERGIDARLVMPAYPQAVHKAVTRGPGIALGDLPGFGHTRLIEARMPDSGAPLWLVDNPMLYDRDGGPYQRVDGWEHDDNFRRFALLSRVAAMIANGRAVPGWQADVVHANDWQTGLVSAYLTYDAAAGAPLPKTVFTIHNLHFQGIFGREILPMVGLPEMAFTIHGLEFMGKVSYLKAGLYYSDHLTTVSPTYAWEITTAQGGRGLDGLLAGRAASGQLSGVLNGVDYSLWSPNADPLIAAPYDATNVAQGKAANKADLQAEFGLSPRPDALVLGLVSRFSDQKGVDLVIEAAPALVEAGAQIILVGTGDPALEQAARTLAGQFPSAIATVIGYDESLAHRVQAASDLFLVPSRFEPCGLTQLYALRYGALPLVRRTGGLADTVRDIATLNDRQGTGFLFDDPSAEGLLQAFYRAQAVYQNPQAWHLARQRAMAENFSWERAADEYRALYEQLTDA